jgi:hypothetical protein
MRLALSTSILLALASCGQAAPRALPGAIDSAQVALLPPAAAQLRLLDKPDQSRYWPVVIWHGLGDECNSDGMVRC